MLGLDEDASPEAIKAAYRETAQILHPDRFAGNKKLADRATEQFKHLQEAYEYLTSGRGASGASGADGRGSAGRSASTGASSGDSTSAQRGRASYTAADELHARLAGIAAARTQLVAQRDTLLDQRKHGMGFLVVGLLVAVLFRRLRPIAGIAGAAFVWGLIDYVSANSNLKDLNTQLKKLASQKQALLEQLEDLE